MTELAPLRFRDVPGRRRDPDAGLPDVRGRRAEAEVCAFYLEHAAGPRQRSLTSDERLKMPSPGRSLGTVDVEQTVQLIELALRDIQAPWRGPVVVALGWGVGPKELQAEKPADGGLRWLERAGFSQELPAGLTRHALRSKARELREALIAHGVIDRSMRRYEDAEDVPASARSFTREDGMLGMGMEAPLIGWDQIGEYLGVHRDTARRWAAELGLPVSQPARRRRVRAYPSVIQAWKSTPQGSGAA